MLTEEVSGALTKSYRYSPWGERLSQVKHSSDGTTEARAGKLARTAAG